MRIRIARTAFALAILGAAFSVAQAPFSPAEAARIIRDMCNQTSGDGQGHDCAGPDDALVRPKYSDGTCGDWMCCPPNGDGTYDCTKATNPTSAAVSDRLKAVLGPRAAVIQQADPAPKPPSVRDRTMRRPDAVLRRQEEPATTEEAPADPDDERRAND